MIWIWIIWNQPKIITNPVLVFTWNLLNAPDRKVDVFAVYPFHYWVDQSGGTSESRSLVHIEAAATINLSSLHTQIRISSRG